MLVPTHIISNSFEFIPRLNPEHESFPFQQMWDYDLRREVFVHVLRGDKPWLKIISPKETSISVDRILNLSSANETNG